MQVIITGVAGFIGCSLAKKLLNRNHCVIGIDNMCYKSFLEKDLKRQRLYDLLKNPNFRFIESDICLITKNILEKYSISSIQSCPIVHLAAHAGVRDSMHLASSYIQSNIIGFVKALEISREINSRHFLYASSSSVYGDIINSGAVPLIKPTSVYAVTKYTDELLAAVYSSQLGIKTTGLRFFSVYGPYGRPDMAPWIFTSKIRQNLPLMVANGGNVFWDFTYIDDVVDSIIRILNKEPDNLNTTVDIGAGDPRSLNELITIISNYYEKNVKFHAAQLNLYESTYTCSNNTYMANVYDKKSYLSLKPGWRDLLCGMRMHCVRQLKNKYSSYYY